MTYLPTVIATHEPERVIRPGQWRPERIALPSPATTDLQAGIVHAMLGNEPRGFEWYNSLDATQHGTPDSGVNMRSNRAVYLDDYLLRYVLDTQRLDSNNLIFCDTDQHPLYLATEFNFAAWVYFHAAANEQRFLTLRRGTAPGLILGSDSVNASRVRVYVNDGTRVFDGYTNTDYPVGEWFRLTLAWAGGNTVGCRYNDTAIAFTLRTGTGPLEVRGSGTIGNADLAATQFSVADMLLWDASIGNVNAAAFLDDNEDASLHGWVRGADLPRDNTSHRGTIRSGYQYGSPIALDRSTGYADKLLAYWPFEQTYHQHDYGPHGYHLDVEETSKELRQTAFFRDARGMLNSNYGRLIERSQTDIWPTDSVTVSLWVRNLTTANSSVFGNVINLAPASERFNLHCVFGDGDIDWDFGGTTSGTSRVTVTPPNMQDRWRHVLVYAEAGVGMGVYVDGRLLGSHTSASTPTRVRGTEASCLFYGASYYYNGLLAEMAVWERQLSEAEKFQLFREPLVLRKQLITGQSAAGWSPPSPAAPVSNARTIVRPGLLVERESPESAAEDYTLNTDDPLARRLRCWFAPTQSQQGQRLVDHARITPSMLYYASAYSADVVQFDPRYGGHWQFDGVDARSTCEDSTTNEIAFGIKPWAIEVLLRADDTVGTQYLVSHGQVDTGASNVLNFGLRLEGAKVRFVYRDSGNTAWYFTTTTGDVITAGQWHHVWFWHNGGSSATDYGFFVDGEAVAKTDGSTLNAAPQTADVPLKFGAAYDGGTATHASFYAGDLGFCRIYFDFPSAGEVQRIYRHLRDGRDPLKRSKGIGRLVEPIAMPSRHWVGEDSDWFTARNWSRSAGGVRGAGVPGCDNPVLFDAERPVYE